MFPLHSSPLNSVPLTPIAPSLPSPTQPQTNDPISESFSALLGDTMAAEQRAHSLIETSLLGGDVTQAEVMASVKKADLSIRMLMQVRNKVVAALNEIQQMRF